MRNPFGWLFQGEGKETVVKTRGKTLSVSETDSSKTLSINGTIQSVLMKNSEYSRDYWDLFPPLCYVFERPRVFMIGLGGGTIAHQIERRFGGGASMDIAEVDGEVVELSKKFFGLGQRHRVVVGDGARLLHGEKGRYDMIILDAYDGDTIPEQFLSTEFARDAWETLRQRGILAINYISTMRGNGQLEEYMRTLSRHFDVYEARIRHITWNSVIVCSKGIGKDEIVKKIGSGLGHGNYDVQILSAYENMEHFGDEMDDAGDL